MPFLRVLRDKRGYETTYLVHWFRDGNRQRSRILYVFRTPPGVRVGCKPFEPAVMRELQRAYPDIAFDWRALVENQQVVEPPPERRPRKPKPTEAAGEAPAAKPEAPPAEAAEQPPSAPAAGAPRPAGPRFVIPTTVEGATPEEQTAWLRGWYDRIREQIPHRTHDPARREALLALAERLNPDAWGGEEAVAAHVESAAEALLRLSHVFSKRRRRPRRAARPAPGEAPPDT